jgi:hypothetical protein
MMTRNFICPMTDEPCILGGCRRDDCLELRRPQRAKPPPPAPRDFMKDIIREMQNDPDFISQIDELLRRHKNR